MTEDAGRGRGVTAFVGKPQPSVTRADLDDTAHWAVPDHLVTVHGKGAFSDADIEPDVSIAVRAP